jgi:hypothetical protein
VELKTSFYVIEVFNWNEKPDPARQGHALFISLVVLKSFDEKHSCVNEHRQ